MLGLIKADADRIVREDFGRLVVACLQHAFAAQYLEALIVSVRRAAAGIDLRQAAAPRADRDRGGVDVSKACDRLIGEAASRRIQRLRLVFEDPAEDVEIVN